MTTAVRVETLGLFILCMLLICLFLLTIAGMFPAEHRPRSLRGPIGATALYVTIAIMVLLILRTAAFAAGRIEWYFAIIAAGLAFLASPFVFTALPARVRDGAMGVGVLTGAGIVLHVFLLVA